MDPVLRAAAIYLGLLLVLRVMGKRSLAQVTTFDFILLLIISEATQQALLGDDFSITNALLVVITLVVLDRGLDSVQHRSPVVSRVTQSLPVVLVADGDPLQEVLDREKVDVKDVLQEARTSQGIHQLDQIRYAVLERSGAISIVPK